MLNTITINNFKCFSQQTIEFGLLTVLAGTNGVGKSTVIQALLLLRQAIENNYEKNILLNGPFLLNLGNSNEIINSAAKGSVLSFELRGDFCKEDFKFSAPDGSLSLVPIEEKSTSGEYRNVSIHTEEFYYLNAERFGPRNIQSVVDQRFINTGYQGEFTGQAISKIENSNVKFNANDPRVLIAEEGEKYYSVKKQIELWMDYIVPGVQINIDAYPKVNLVRTSLKRMYAETDFLNPYNIGFGITYLLPIIVTCLTAPENSLVIIENPEAHLHPQGQSRVGQFLSRVASSGVQVIIETHSDHVINGIRISGAKGVLPCDSVNINFFSQARKATSPNVELVKLKEKGELTHWPVGFLDQEEQDLAELFRLKRAL